jgi:hypothetical protein
VTTDIIELGSAKSPYLTIYDQGNLLVACDSKQHCAFHGFLGWLIVHSNDPFSQCLAIGAAVLAVILVASRVAQGQASSDLDDDACPYKLEAA